MRFYVYEIVRRSDGRVLYVGKGLRSRLLNHRWCVRRIEAGKTVRQQRRLYEELALLRSKGDDFCINTVFRTEDEFEAYLVESERIQHYGLDNLLNVTPSLFRCPFDAAIFAAFRKKQRERFATKRQERVIQKKREEAEYKRRIEQIIQCASSDPNHYKWGKANVADPVRLLSTIFSLPQ